MITRLWGVARIQPDGTMDHVELPPSETEEAARSICQLLADDFPETEYTVTVAEVLPVRRADQSDPLHALVQAAILAEYDKLAAAKTVGDPPDFCYLFATAALEAIRNGAP